MASADDRKVENAFRKLMFKSSPSELTEADIEYFRDNPELIDEVTAPVNIHKYFLWLGTVLGMLLNKQQDNASHWRSEIRRRIGADISGS